MLLCTLKKKKKISLSPPPTPGGNGSGRVIFRIVADIDAQIGAKLKTE